MNRTLPTVLALLVLAACAREITVTDEIVEEPLPNVILMVGDGFGVGAWSLGRTYAETLGRPLVLDDAEAVGFLDTRCGDGLVTDSAAAATAWSTGYLAPQDAVGQIPGRSASLLFERLAEAGLACGFVTTARVTHHTPAPFYARAEHESDEEEIARQLLEARPSVALGGGRRHFLPKGAGGTRRDGGNLLAEAESLGFAVLEDFSVPLPNDRPVLGLFSHSHLPHELDRSEAEPDLAAMTVAAIRRLEAEGRRWFLLVEEGRIDSACHVFDGASVAANTVRFDRAVEAALKSTEGSPTVVLVTGDHTTSNPTLLEFAHPESLSVVNASVELIERRIFEGRSWKGTPRSLKAKALPILDEAARHTGLSAEDIDRLLRARNHYERQAALGKALSRRFGIGFLAFQDYLDSVRQHGHTGNPVPLRAWGPRAAEVAGVKTHAELGRWIDEVLGLSERASRVETPGPADPNATVERVGAAAPASGVN